MLKMANASCGLVQIFPQQDKPEERWTFSAQELGLEIDADELAQALAAPLPTPFSGQIADADINRFGGANESAAGEGLAWVAFITGYGYPQA